MSAVILIQIVKWVLRMVRENERKKMAVLLTIRRTAKSGPPSWAHQFGQPSGSAAGLPVTTISFKSGYFTDHPPSEA